MATTKKAPKLPTTLAGCADRLYKVRETRLAAEKAIEDLKAEEALLREHLINNLPKSSATGISGKVATVRIENKVIPQVEDWGKFYKYIAANASKGAFALMQRRVSETAVQELWDAGRKVPGVVAFQTPVVRMSKRK